MSITAQQVSELRQKTGMGMGKCKEALVATNGIQEAAIEWLRLNTKEKPEMLARPTGEGAIALSIADDGKTAAFATLLCETDFAARNDLFKKLAERLAKMHLIGDNLFLIPGIISDGARVIKENIRSGVAEKLTLEGVGTIGSYLHSNGKLAVLVGVNVSDENALQHLDLKVAIRDVAMHIAGASPSPIGVGRSCIPSELVDKEKAFIAAQLVADPGFAKKPANIQTKIVDGKMGKFYKEKTLLEQPFVKDETKTVEQYLAEVSKKIGATLNIAWFVRQGLNDE